MPTSTKLDPDLEGTSPLSQATPVKEVAALDLGSNSFHLVVARIVAHDVQILHRLKFQVQLADGLDEDDRLSPEAISRGIETLHLMADSLRDFEPDQVRIVATYTLRKARNSNDFVRAARKILPYPVEVITGIEEARLIYLGVAHTNHHEGNRLVIDIGGGSTEVIVGEGFEPKLLQSLPIGCVTFSHRHFKDGRIRAKDFSKAIKRARQEIETVSDTYIEAGWGSCVGSSGTARSIIEIVHAKGTKSQENRVTYEDLQNLMQECVDAGNTDNLNFSGLSEDRRHVLPGGLAIMMALFESLGIKVLEYSSGALREGVIYEMEDRLSALDIRSRTAQSLVTRYVVDLDQARRVEQTTLGLFDQVCEDWDIADPDLRNVLSWAALLHEVGLQIHSKNVHRHSEYILRNVELPGFNREEQGLLATLARFQRKKIQPADLRESMIVEQPKVVRLVTLLRLGVLLNFKRHDELLPEITAKAKKKQQSIILHFADEWLETHPVFAANLEREIDQIKALSVKLQVS